MRASGACRVSQVMISTARYVDEKLAAFALYDSAVISTRLRHAAETSSCQKEPTSPSCAWSSTPSSPPSPPPNYDSDSYIAWPENFTLAIVHGFSAQIGAKINHYNGARTVGVLRDVHRNPVDVCALGFPSPSLCLAARSSFGAASNAADIITFGTLLQAVRSPSSQSHLSPLHRTSCPHVP